MLSSLQIENVAVIQKADVHFEKGLNVLTGETGAGKSILIDSINAILGSRTSRELVRTGASKAVIRAAFDHVPAAVQDSLEKAGYERSDELLLTREITAEGKSSCRINGMPATAAVLRELCGGLININGQHDSVGLLNPARHEGILDDYAQNRAAYQDYYQIYRQLIAVKRELDSLVTDEAEKRRRTDLLQYQVDEIDAAALAAGEEETLEARRKVLANASTIREQIARAHAALSGGDEAAGGVDLLGEASNAIDAAAQLDSGLADSAGQLLDLYYTAKDLSAELASRLEDYESNDGELNEIEQRLDLLYKLKRKYGGTVEDVIAFGEKAREELERIQFSQEHHDRLEAYKFYNNFPIPDTWKPNLSSTGLGWNNNWFAMARKTVLKLLIQRWGELSIEIEEALEADQAAFKDIDSDPIYVDNTGEIVDDDTVKGYIVGEGEAASAGEAPESTTEATTEEAAPENGSDAPATQEEGNQSEIERMFAEGARN